ncbi:hypothetical protein MXB_1754 [Myxobolus squamalis]|nr:hypothetical protein MXB_1754 [Myxobolus squamalis]
MCCSEIAAIIILSEIFDAEPEVFLNNFIHEKALCLDLYSQQIYQTLLLRLREKYSSQPNCIPSKRKIYGIIRKLRGSMFANSIQVTQLPPLKHLPNGNPFFGRYWSGDFDGEFYQMLLWSTNEALSLMRYNNQTFIDSTFRCVPSPFTHCLIIVMYDIETQMYIPCVYALVTFKNEYMYLTALHEVIVLENYMWMPLIITSDFEFSLIAALKHEFPESGIMCCYFYLMKTIESKTKKYKISNENSSRILQNIELLTAISISEINEAIQHQEDLNSFWTNFIRTWIMRFDPTLRSLLNTDNFEIFGRTNNGLKRYNRRIRDHFVNAYPKRILFILLKQLERSEKIHREFNIDKRKFTVPKIKQEYLIWKNSNQQAHFILKVFGDWKV